MVFPLSSKWWLIPLHALVHILVYNEERNRRASHAARENPALTCIKKPARTRGWQMGRIEHAIRWRVRRKSAAAEFCFAVKQRHKKRAKLLAALAHNVALQSTRARLP